MPPMAESDWQDMNSAPRDGTVVEIKNSYGLLPTYGLFQWDTNWGGKWSSATQPGSGLVSGVEHKFQWRPYAGDSANYVDYNPSDDDWRRAVRRPWF